MILLWIIIRNRKIHLIMFNSNLLLMKLKKILWFLGLIAALISAAITYCSCSVLALTAGKANSTITTSTSTQTIIDSTKVVLNSKH